MDLVIIIVSFNTSKILKDCLNSIFQKRWQTKFNVVLVDNASSDDSVQMVKKNFPRVEIITSDKNLGFAAGNNLAFKKVKARNYLLLNSDTIILKDSLDILTDFMIKYEYGIGSCKLLNPDKSLQPNAGDLPAFWPTFFWLSGLDDVLLFLREMLPSVHRKFKNFYKGERQVGWVGGAVMFIKGEVAEKIGFLDEAIFMYGEDVEYCLRASRAGFKVGWTEKAEIVHIGGASSKDPAFRQWLGEYRGLVYIYQKFYGLFATFLLKGMIYLFTTMRVLAFALVGKFNVSLTYAKILVSF